MPEPGQAIRAERLKRRARQEAARASWQRQLNERLCDDGDDSEPCGEPVEAEGRCARHYGLWCRHWRDICPGRCNDPWREADTAYQRDLTAWEAAVEIGGPPGRKPDPPDFAPERPAPVFCGRCTASVRGRLLDIRDLAAEVEAENLGLRKGPDAERVSGSRRHSSPSMTGDDLDELASMLRDWESKAWGHDPLNRRGHLNTEIACVAAVLATQAFPVLMGSYESAVEFARDVHSWYRRLRDATRTGTGRHQKNRPCPRCDRFSLVWEEGDDHVACTSMSPRRCGKVLSLDEYAEYDRLFDHMTEARRQHAAGALARGPQASGAA